MGHNVDHPITDTKQDGYFQINPVTREISNSGDSKKLTLIKNDHNSEVFTFELPRMIEGHDMSLCNQVTVHFINMGSSKDTSENVYTIYKRNVDDPELINGVFFKDPGMSTSDLVDGRTYDDQFGVLATFDDAKKEWIVPESKEEQVVVGTWLISRAATKYRGNLSFVVRFECLGKENISTFLFADDILTLDNGKKVTAKNDKFEYEDGTDALTSDSEIKELTLNDGRIISLSEDGYPQVIETVFPVVYSWSSAIYSKIVVADTHDNSEEALEPYHDILENWWNKICEASNTLYAITDDGVLLDVTEKVNGLENNVTELRETVESLEQTVESNKNECDQTLENARSYTDSAISDATSPIKTQLSTVETNHNNLQSKVDGLPTTSTTLYKHDIMLGLETSSEAPSESRTLTVHAISIITNSKTSPEFTFINGKPNSVNCVKITGEIIKMTYHGPTGQNIKIIELPDDWSAKWPSSLNIGYPLFIASLNKLSYIENTDIPLTYAQKFYRIKEDGEWSDIAITQGESYVSSNFSKHINTTQL